MIEKSEVLQMLTKIEQQLSELETIMDDQIHNEILKSANGVIQSHLEIENKIAGLEESMKDKAPSKRYIHLKKHAFQIELQELV
jgi:hypothetical protein